ncbi:MAG: L,D-transpeptidase family protein [Halioglobus sp.]
MRSLTITPLALLLVLFTSPILASPEEEIRLITEHLVLDGDGQLPAGGTVYQPKMIQEIYFEDDHQLVWQNRDQVAGVLGILADSAQDGLNPEDYHYTELKRMLDTGDAHRDNWDRSRALFDVLLTDGVLLYVRHLMQGKVDPRATDPSFNYARLDFQPKEVSSKLRQAIQADTIADIMEQARPRLAFYLQMKNALAHYRELASSTPFTSIADDVVLKPGQSHDNVIHLRKRLQQSGYLDAAAPVSRDYDAGLEEAVRRFQRDNVLDVDGIVGRQSYTLLNLSWAQRVDSLRINMDRLRWIYRDLSDDIIMVNIAGFELYYLRDNKLVWETPVMTGTIAHQTPMFTERLKYLEFNPIWTVPRSIISRSLFPKFSANPQYVLDNNYYLFDRNGRRADPLTMDWPNYSSGNFPYSVVQQPGAKNALGRVKFIFPNRHAIYLHDTPSRALFSRSSRAFSSGCVRVKQPLEFAEILLDDPDNWSLEQVQELVQSGEPQRRVNLKREVDVMLMYWTTSPILEGGIQFHADIYSKDAAMLATLNAPPSVY